MATSVRQLREEAIENATKKVSLHNPDDKDFEYQWFGKKGVFPAQSTQEFDYFTAQHIRKHLAEHLLYTRGSEKNALEAALAEIYKEIDT
jgi:hypothetical protein